MTKIQIELPDDLSRQLSEAGKNRKEFILEAIREKVKRKEELRNKLIEGYQATYEEDQNIADDFESTDLENWK